MGIKTYWIGSVEDYEYHLTQVVPDGRVSKHAPIYNHDKTMVLVAGYGELTLDDVKAYQQDNDWYVEVSENEI